MSTNEIKLFIPKFEQKPQKSLYTPATKPQIKKPVALFSINMLTQEIKDSITEEESDKLYDLFDEADKEDLFGRFFGENAMNDSILNENEQKNFLALVKEKLPKVYDLVNSFVEKLQSKSDEEIIAKNLYMKKEDWGLLHGNEQVISYGLQYLNNENIMAVYSKYEDTCLLYQLYTDAKERADEEIPDEEFNPDEWFDEGEERTEEKTEEYKKHHEEYKNKRIQVKENGIKDLEIIKEKSLDYVNYLIQLARRSNIYVEDYTKALESIIEKDDIENLAILTMRLSDRIFMKQDKEAKTVNASKRAIELKEANGQIDSDFIQGYTGDCWFLSALKSLCTDKEVLYQINNMITLNKENDEIKSITVKIQDKEYTIPYENIKAANEYSTGDLDVRALEMAVNQYMHENNILQGDITLGGWDKEAYKILFGEDNVEIAEYTVKDEYGYDQFDPKAYLTALKENKDSKIISGLGIGAYFPWGDEDEKLYADDKDGKQVELHRQHAYSYTRIDEKYFYFTDPHAPGKELRVLQENFGKIFDGATTVKFKNKEQVGL